jgi:hypothetical protein
MRIGDLVKFMRALKAGALAARELLTLGGVFEVECFDSEGVLKWRDVAINKIPNAALNSVLGINFHGDAQITAWYVGLTGATPTGAATDTMASHAGWTEVSAYSQANRPAFTVAAASGQQVTNSASPASFSINGTATVGGAFIVSNSTINGTTGTLFSVAAFSQGNKSCSNGDTVNVTYTLTGASST